MKKFLLLLTLFSQSFACDILFVLHDQGEIKAFERVLPQLKSRYRVVQFKDKKRSDLLSEEELESLCNTYQPKLVVTGVSYSYMGQILDRFESAQKVCFWDNFSPDGTGDYFSTGHKVIQHADVVFVPSLQFANHPMFKDLEAVGVEHPVFDLWIEADGRKVREFYGFNASHTSVLFLGGYGEAFERAFRSFEEVVKEREDIDLVIAHHPKLGKEMPFQTPDLVDGFDLIVTNQSTAGLLAVKLGKRVIFYTPDDPEYTNEEIEAGNAKRVTSIVGINWVLDDLESWEEPTPSVKGRSSDQLAWMLDRMSQ